MGEAKVAMKEVFNLNVNGNDAVSLDDRIAMLNTDQRCVFDTIKAHLLHQQRHESDACQCKDFKPLAMFVSGVGVLESLS